MTQLIIALLTILALAFTSVVEVISPPSAPIQRTATPIPFDWQGHYRNPYSVQYQGHSMEGEWAGCARNEQGKWIRIDDLPCKPLDDLREEREENRKWETVLPSSIATSIAATATRALPSPTPSITPTSTLEPLPTITPSPVPTLTPSPLPTIEATRTPLPFSATSTATPRPQPTRATPRLGSSCGAIDHSHSGRPEHQHGKTWQLVNRNIVCQADSGH